MRIPSRLAALSLFGLAGCFGSSDEAAEAPSKEAAEAAAEAAVPPPELPSPSDSDELVPVEITWQGVGDLYKTFFQDQAALTELSRRLAPHVKAPALLTIRYDSEAFVGGIRLVVPPGGWRTPPKSGRGAVDLQSLAPVTVALATYQTSLAERYDLRVQSLFSAGVDLYRGSRLCEVSALGEPPDGRTVSPCVTVNGAEICGMPGDGGVRFADADWSKVSGCFE